MVYNFNLGIGWASSGVEYAQAYRAKMLRRIGIDAKFIFTDMFPRENIEHMTKNIGFLDSEIMWLYTFFTDTKIAPVSFTLKMLENTFTENVVEFNRKGKKATYLFPGENNFYTVYMVDEDSDRVHRVEIVANGFLIRKDYYTYCKIYSEFYGPLKGAAHLYGRRYYNENGTSVYDEIIDDDSVMYKFADRVLYSKEELVSYMAEKLEFTENDIVIIDRFSEIGQAILQKAGKAKVVSVVHADHFSESATDDDNILWNNFYEYDFSQQKKLAYYITSTDEQNILMKEHFEKYTGEKPNIYTIPVGGLEKLTYPSEKRKKHSLITASRLASEKHIDWIIEAVSLAREDIPDITLDIYGKGGEERSLIELIEKKGCTDFIKMMGQHNLDDKYVKYEAYIAGSTSEGFGLTLMEAVGSGLPIIGFNVRYGNPTFIDDGKNGYLIPIYEKMGKREKVCELKNKIIELFSKENLEEYHNHSYQKAEEYLAEKVAEKWEKVLKK